MEEFGL